jgi:cysteine synthase
MISMHFEPQIVNRTQRQSAVERLRQAKVALPTFEELAHPTRMRAPNGLGSVGPDEPRPENLWRVHWHNDERREGLVDVPGHVVLPRSLTGVKAPIVVLLGRRFPMIGAHKVLAAYACLVPRLVTGQFDPAIHKAVWPSTGNYCRGGVAISRILGCRGVAVLPAGMSRERFDWLQQWVAEPSDIIRTPGTESNVKEIYDKCGELARDPQNVIVNQFSEFGNYLVH